MQLEADWKTRGRRFSREELERRNAAVVEMARAYLDPETGKIPPARAAAAYATIGERFGLGAPRVRDLVPPEMKVTARETMLYARAQRGQGRRKAMPEDDAAVMEIAAEDVSPNGAEPEGGGMREEAEVYREIRALVMAQEGWEEAPVGWAAVRDDMLAEIQELRAENAALRATAAEITARWEKLRELFGA